MSARNGLRKTQHRGLFFTEHPSRKHGVKYDRKWTIRQTLGGTTRISVIGWTSEGILIGTALNKMAEYKANYNWNLHNPDKPPKPLCIADEKKIYKAIAKAKEAARQREKSRPTFNSLWEDYSRTLKKSLAADRSRFNKYLKDLHNKTPEEFHLSDIEMITKKLEDDRLSPQTRKHCLTLITRIINYGIEHQKCKPLPFKIKKPKFNNEVTEVLTAEQLELLLEAIELDIKTDPYTGRAMLLALCTGMRRSAILRLKWNDIDYTLGFIYLKHAKSMQENVTHEIPLNEAAKQILNDIPKTESPYVFPGKRGENGEWKQRSDFNRGSKRIMAAAKLTKDFRPFHGLRHHYASTLINTGKVTLYTLQKLLTHASPETTKRYAHIADKTLKQAATVANNFIDRTEKVDRKISKSIKAKKVKS